MDLLQNVSEVTSESLQLAHHLQSVMSNVATPEFLSYIKSLYPSQPRIKNPWYLIAAVAFSAANLPEAVPFVFQHALKDLSQQSTGADQDSLLLARRMKDAIFKSGMLSGYSKVDHLISCFLISMAQKDKPEAINALSALHDTLPESLRDIKPLRYVHLQHHVP